MARLRARSAPPVARVTNAPVPHSKDVGRRTNLYVTLMVVRTLSFVLAVALPLPVPVRVGLMVAAVVIPYVAVLLANAGRETVRPSANLLAAPPRTALER